MRRQRNLSQLKEQEKTPKKKRKTNEIKISNLSGKEFKALVIRVITKSGKRIDECRILTKN